VPRVSFSVTLAAEPVWKGEGAEWNALGVASGKKVSPWLTLSRAAVTPRQIRQAGERPSAAGIPTGRAMPRGFLTEEGPDPTTRCAIIDPLIDVLSARKGPLSGDFGTPGPFLFRENDSSTG
jgi:hypothetical protein